MSDTPTAPPDRRRFKRFVVGMPVQAVRPDTPQHDPRRMVGLHVLNVSRGGVGAIAQDALAPREPLTLFFPPLGPGPGRDMPGQVIRCEESGDRFAVGIAFAEPWPEREAIRRE